VAEAEVDQGAAVTFAGVVRAPSWERRAAAVLHPVGHSVGLVVVAEDPGHGEFSWRVDETGTVHELGGWGWAGPIPELDETNSPPTLVAVHTVLVDGDDAAVLVGLRELVEEHVERYAGCQVWLSGPVGDDVAEWVRTGCPEPWVTAAPADEEPVT
jgi:hypothetical protein